MLFPLKLSLVLFSLIASRDTAQVLSVYSQCGGIGYTGSTVCPDGLFCQSYSQWWSQCNPSSNAQPDSTSPSNSALSTDSESRDTATETSSLVITPQITTQIATQGHSGNVLVRLWGQCGGISYTGSTTCAPGGSCALQSIWYSQCMPGGQPNVLPTTTREKNVVTTRGSNSDSVVTLGPSDFVSGFYWWTWSMNVKPPSGINMGVCFSGYVTVSDALRDCASIVNQLPGAKYLSLGGGNAAGIFTRAALTQIDADINSQALKGWQGVVYDIEEGDAGLAAAFKASFANSKRNGLSVLVTTSHSRPYGITDGSQLMTGFFADSNIDYISPQLYTSGQEAANDFTAIGTSWQEYATSKAKIVPSVILGSRDFSTARSYFSTNFGVNIAGYVQWAQ